VRGGQHLKRNPGNLKRNTIKKREDSGAEGVRSRKKMRPTGRNSARSEKKKRENHGGQPGPLKDKKKKVCAGLMTQVSEFCQSTGRAWSDLGKIS